MERSTVGSLLRSTQAFCQQICEKQTFDFGIAFSSTRFAGLPDASQIREVTLNDAQAIGRAFEQANAWFESRGLRCLRWSTAIDTPTHPLAEFLMTHGFTARKLLAFHLAEWRPVHPSSDVRILPARAVRDAFRMTFVTAQLPADPVARGLLADSFAERLDDHQLDMFVAMVDKQPAGRCGLHQVGDIARILDLSILPQFADRGVEQSLLAHVLTMARRLTMPMVVVQASEKDGRRCELLKGFGFQDGGHVMEFETASAFASLPAV